MFLFPTKKNRSTDGSITTVDVFPTGEIINHFVAGNWLCSNGCIECEGVIQDVTCTEETVELTVGQQRLPGFGPNDWSIDRYDGVIELFVQGRGVLYIDLLPA